MSQESHGDSPELCREPDAPVPPDEDAVTLVLTPGDLVMLEYYLRTPFIPIKLSEHARDSIITAAAKVVAQRSLNQPMTFVLPPF